MERFFLGSNTARGFCSLYEEALAPLEEVVLLKGGPGTGKSSLMKKVMRESVKRGYDLECWHCSGDPSSLDGVCVKGAKRAVIDATPPHAVEPKAPVVKEKIINLLDCVDDDIKVHKNEIEKLANDKKECFVRAYEHLNIAFCHFNQIKRILFDSVDIVKLCREARAWAGEVFVEKNERKAEKRFASAITPDGVVKYSDHLKNKNLVVVKGDDLMSSLVASEMMKVSGADLVFVNPFYVDFIDGYTIGDIAVVKASDVTFDKTACEIDLKEYETGLEHFALSYGRSKMEEEISTAVECMSKARGCHMAIEKFYVAHLDFEKLDEMKGRVFELIFH